MKMGYTRRAIVEQLGDFALRGGIIDVFPSTTSEPFRLEFFGDDIESIRNFSVLSQRSLKRLKKAVILPLREILVDSQIVETTGELLPQDNAIALHDALGPNSSFDGLEFFRPLFNENLPTLPDFLPNDSIIILDDRPLIDSEIEKLNENTQRQ